MKERRRRFGEPVAARVECPALVTCLEDQAEIVSPEEVPPRPAEYRSIRLRPFWCEFFKAKSNKEADTRKIGALQRSAIVLASKK